MPKILFIAPHRPGRSPSQRFRFEHYISYFKQQGYECDLSWIVSEKDDKKLYSKGHYFTKFKVFVKAIAKRWKDVKRANNYDIVFVQREAFMTGSTFFERQLAKKKPKLIFDFDDAIWLLDVSAGNEKLAWLKNPGKTAKLIAVADVVIAGNQFLAEYAIQYSNRVEVIPTTIDTDYHVPMLEKRNQKQLVIGWTGSQTTLKHYRKIVPVLKKLKEKYGQQISFKVIADMPPQQLDGLEIEFIKWNKETEIQDLNTFDIGLMPLPDNEWAKGKCAFKALQYMACEIPAVISPVGMNKEILQQGESGFFASTDEEWWQHLAALIESEALRKKVGAAARQTVIERYSLAAHQQRYVQLFQKAGG